MTLAGTQWCRECQTRGSASLIPPSKGWGYKQQYAVMDTIVDSGTEALRRILEPERAQRGEDFDPAGFSLWKERSRAINSVLSFASSTVAEANIAGGGNAPPHFALNGSVYHNVGPIQANPGRTPANLTSQHCECKQGTSGRHQPAGQWWKTLRT